MYVVRGFEPLTCPNNALFVYVLVYANKENM
jgi:hypothetical protein